MATPTQPNIRAIAEKFQLSGEFISAEPYGSGHINDTFRATFNQHGQHRRYILQRINQNVFKHPIALMENVQRVTAHLAAKVAGELDSHRRALTLVPARDGTTFFRDDTDNVWRASLFIGAARSYDTVEKPAQAQAAAQSFGRFQKMIADLPAPRLHDTIPDFHHTPKRFAALEQTIAADPVNRAAQAKAEIAFALRHQTFCHVLLDAKLPERVTHNDTKLDNVLLDDASGEGLCVIDLDTVMPGLVPYDFGDMVRTMTSPAKEDERDLSKVTMQFPMFEALAHGYLAATAEFLTPAEKKFLPSAGKLITFETGIRFLTDFLAGDTYFKVHREAHNLDRCRRQFRLMESIEQQEAAMNKLVESI